MSKHLKWFVHAIAITAVVAVSPRLTAQTLPSGDAQIRAPYADSEIVITTTRRLAGAVHSLTWRGQEFINSADHGRQLQAASNFDLRSRFTGETFNPTEAGSRADGAGPKSTSRLLHLVTTENSLQTTSQMAFWLRPGDLSSGNPAKNKSELSDHLLTKRITIGYQDLPNVITWDVTFSVPVGEDHSYAQFEAVTGYMPPKFEDFFGLDMNSRQLLPLTDGPGEQALPVVFSTSSGSHAMGVYSPQQPSVGYKHAGYGRFRFAAQKVVKWNCVFRIREPKIGIAAGDYRYRCFVVVGTKAAVKESLLRLHQLSTTSSESSENDRIR